MRRLKRWLLGLTLIYPLHAQSVTTVETTLPIQASQVQLGTNIGNNSFEYSLAQAAHMKWGRFDCGWANPGVETQNLPANTSGGYNLPSQCASQLSFSATYGINPVVNALFGPPAGSILSTTTSTDSPSGSTVIHIAGTVPANEVDGQTQLYPAGGNFYGAKASFTGILIVAHTTNTVTLASALTADMPSGTAVNLNLLLYPPVIVLKGQNYLTNPGVVAYKNYAAYLAAQIHAYGLTGQVSLWNEPPTSNDPWDHGANFYDTPPTNIQNIASNLGIDLPLAVANATPPSGVTYDNGYTEITGNGTILSQQGGNLLWMTNLFSAQKAFGSESFHPYDNNPEDSTWAEPCLQQNSNNANYNNIYQPVSSGGCVLPLTNSGSSFKSAVAYSYFPNIFGGLRHEITEGGISLNTSGSPTNTQITRYDLRYFLAYEGRNINPVMFYRLYENPNSDGLAWCTGSTPTCYPVYTAFKNLMADIIAINGSPVGPYPPCTMPKVTFSGGTYPLSVVPIVGSVAGNLENSILLFTWQRSNSTGPWPSLASPPNGTVTIPVPSGFTTTLKNATTGTAVTPISGGGPGTSLSYFVSDDPIELLFSPLTPTTPAQKMCN